MALIFMVFSFGIYELFVSKIDKGVAADDEKIRGKILDIPNLASLESKLALPFIHKSVNAHFPSARIPCT